MVGGKEVVDVAVEGDIDTVLMTVMMMLGILRTLARSRKGVRTVIRGSVAH